ncbi:ATP-dependent zinc protease [Maridesulfovibrio ferrireducens]|uniref:ATP-dependent zinc protease family protein n=1 Tax=Maridesulfovibrio ferrireducens TaxID=246191 RepID=UPI001A2BB772|nr:ATP-dependent zinc protease [Maridesulfovibrio ferrireducens]MBI9109780.1 ATP-dependent zinc protease [Maridesulfovibrio ferrireducens]
MKRPETVYGRTIIGWREWASFPELGIPAIKAKVDTGAKTSCLHSFQQEIFEREGNRWIRFGIHPAQRRRDIELFCEAPVVDIRRVTNSGGGVEKRTVIMTPITMGHRTWNIEVTLTNRDTMKFRMLLGRTAMTQIFVVDPHRSYILGKDLAAVHKKKSVSGE